MLQQDSFQEQHSEPQLTISASQCKTTNHLNDIGLFIGCKLSDEQRLRLLNEPRTPDKDFNWPYSIRMSKGKEVSLYIKNLSMSFHNYHNLGKAIS